jgi:hypothetical protein
VIISHTTRGTTRKVRDYGEGLVPHDVPESDWKVFRGLREMAVQRFCQRVLEEIVQLTRDASRGHHERYLAVFRLIQERDEELARTFDDPARSRMIVQLATIHALGLLSRDELERFTQSTRSIVESLAKSESGAQERR